MLKKLKILGIETSCDETAAAIVTEDKEIISHLIYHQFAQHLPYGGVVPEIASRAHIDKLDQVIRQVINKAQMDFSDIDAVAVTNGPGLIGGLIVGLMTAKAISSAAKKPLIAINHLEAHALMARMTNNVNFPFLLLLISGGHCQILIVENIGKYRILGTTKDDALGEAFDKVAKMMNLPYPGGPELEKLAKAGDSKRFAFPQAFKGDNQCNFSFSGLKTAVKRTIDHLAILRDQDIADIAASFHLAILEIIEDRLINAIKIFKNDYAMAQDLVITGGVAANAFIRDRLAQIARSSDLIFSAPAREFCTDNGVMVAWAGIERFKLGLIDKIDVEPKARWPL